MGIELRCEGDMMREFGELMERVKRLEEVVLELQQRVTVLERDEAVRVHLSPGARRRLSGTSGGRAARRWHEVEDEGS